MIKGEDMNDKLHKQYWGLIDKIYENLNDKF